MLKKTLLSFLLMPILASAQYTISGKFADTKYYKWAIIYKVSPMGTQFIANTQMDKDGSMSIKLDSTVSRGVYRLVYALPEDIYNFDVLYNGEEDIEFTFSHQEGVKYVNSVENKLLAAYEQEMYALRSQIGRKYTLGYSEVKPLFEALVELQTVFEKESEGRIAQNFIKANRAYVPSNEESLKTYIENVKINYFQYVDFNNHVLQASNFLPKYAYTYVNFFVNSSESPQASYENNLIEVSKIIEETDIEFQKVMWLKLWQKFMDSKNVATANYIAEKFLIPLSASLNDEKLVEQLTVIINTSVGSKAPNFSWKEEKEDKTIEQNLYQTDSSEHYVVAFWSSSCSHCLQEMPKLHSKIGSMIEGKYQVIAIGLESEPYDWKNAVYDFPKFTNVLGLGKWENEIGKAYGIDGTPTYFVLNKDKEIIAKPEDIIELMSFIEGQK